MTRLILSSAVLGLVLGLGGSASAYDWFNGQQADVYATSNLPLVNIGGCDCNGSNDCGNYGCGCADDCCNCGGISWVVDAEITFLQYHRGGNLDTDDIFDFEAAPRITLGVLGANGLGVRARYWMYDHSGAGTINNVPNLTIDVDTYNIDFEVYQQFQVTCHTLVEASFGIRYNDFAEEIRSAGGALVNFDSFSAFGGIFGLKTSTAVGPGAVYARWNTSILMDDSNSTSRGLDFDVSQTQTELGLGYEYMTFMGNAVLTARAGIEWSNWTNYVTDLSNAQRTDVGFGGFVFGAGVLY